MSRARRWLGAVGLAGLGLGLAAAAPDPWYPALSRYARVTALVADRHLDAHGPDELVDRSLVGLVGGLDPYSQYYPPELWARLGGAAAGDGGVVRVGEAEGVVELRLEAVLPLGPAALRRAIGGAAGLLLDLRGCPGGDLDAAVGIVDLFLGAGPVVQLAGRGPGASGTRSATTSPDDLALPVVILVDGRTASAAELIAGALQKAGRARLVGQPSFGKGVAQSLLPLPEGGALRLTDSAWRFADGSALRPGEGLRPDVAVAAPPPDPARRLREDIEALGTISGVERERLLADLAALEAARGAGAGGVGAGGAGSAGAGVGAGRVGAGGAGAGGAAVDLAREQGLATLRAAMRPGP